MMEKTMLYLHSRYKIGQVDPRIFGGFLEHMGRAVYEGVYQPDSSHADESGCRTDVLAALRQLDLTVMRYPGGNFASGYHWQDGIGPRETRPTVQELAWQSIETNQFGTDDFIQLCRQMNWAPMLTVNLGTGTPEEARNWVEYCNSPAGTRYADMRPGTPHDVRLWCLGNEMDGPWQLGHVPADQYAIRAQQAAKMMKDVDPGLELVACGSSGIGLDSYMEWDRTVLEYLGELADYISLHRYVGNRADDTPDFLATGAAIDRQIEEIDAVCRFVGGKAGRRQRAFLCFDEWNVWYKNMGMDGRGQVAPHLIEEVYNLEDALVVAGFLHSFVRHADVVKIANIAQIVNVIAPMLTQGDELLIQSIFYPFAMFSRRRQGVALQIEVAGPTYTGTTNGVVPYIEASAIQNGAALQLFLTNRSIVEQAEVMIAPADLTITAVESAEILTGPDAKAANSWAEREVIQTMAFTEIQLKDGGAMCQLPPLSFVALSLSVT